MIFKTYLIQNITGWINNPSERPVLYNCFLPQIPCHEYVIDPGGSEHVDEKSKFSFITKKGLV